MRKRLRCLHLLTAESQTVRRKARSSVCSHVHIRRPGNLNMFEFLEPDVGPNKSVHTILLEYVSGRHTILVLLSKLNQSNASLPKGLQVLEL